MQRIAIIISTLCIGLVAQSRATPRSASENYPLRLLSQQPLTTVQLVRQLDVAAQRHHRPVYALEGRSLYLARPDQPAQAVAKLAWRSAKQRESVAFIAAWSMVSEAPSDISPASAPIEAAVIGAQHYPMVAKLLRQLSRRSQRNCFAFLNGVPLLARPSDGQLFVERFYLGQRLAAQLADRSAADSKAAAERARRALLSTLLGRPNGPLRLAALR